MADLTKRFDMQTSSTKPKRKPRTGTLLAAGTWEDGTPRWRGRLTLADGTKSERFDVPHGLDEKGAWAFVASWQALEDAQGGMLAKKREKEREKARAAGVACEGETADAWFARYVAVHEALGYAVTQHFGDWKRYVAPHVGTKPIASLTAEDVRAVRDGLTRARLEGRIGGKRALNVWSNAFKTPLSRAFTDDDPKYAAVRVGPYAANPALGIKPPVSLEDAEDDERERQALEPAEALALLACDGVELEERRFYAFVMYSGLSPSEFYGLRFSDLRLDAPKPVIKVERGRDMKTGEEGTTKTRDRIRDVPIHPNLLPLLRAMKQGRAPEDRVFPVEHHRHVERRVAALREHLRRAGVDRPELHDGTSRLRAFDVRSFRTTFATWCARAGYDSAWVATWLGHKPQGTAAKHYVKDTPAFGDVRVKPSAPGVVPPFPALPAALLVGTTGPRSGPERPQVPRIAVRRKGLEDERASHVDGSSQAYENETPPNAPDTPTWRPDAAPPGPASGPAGDVVARALAAALELAVSRGDLELVARLVEELRARRLAAAVNVVDLDTARKAGR